MKLNYLLVFVPIALGLDWAEVNPIVVFLTAALALIPLAGLMGQATEHLAKYLGETVGGLLTASLGNAPEIIISLLALQKGLHDVVKASITGSIIANLLLATGLAIVAGGLRHKTQKFNSTQAGLSAGLLMLAVVGLIVPSLFHHSSAIEGREISREVSVVLIVVYALSLVFTLKTHKQLFQSSGASESADEREAAGAEKEPKEPEEEVWSKGRAAGTLAGVTVVLAIVSEVLTGALEPAADSLGLTPIFAGVILLAMVGNVAEMMNAVNFAMKDKIDLSMGIAVGASTQVALLVAPVLVFCSMLMGSAMDLVFTTFEVVAVTIAVAVTTQITNDGECNWMEGVMLIAVYLLLGIGFFFLPV